MKFNSSIQTLGTKKHLWSLSLDGEIGVLAEGVATSLSAAAKALRDAKNAAREARNAREYGSLESRESAWAHAVLTGGE
jgi:hypothetical protein